MRGMSKKDALACQVSLGLFAGLLGIASTAHGAPIYDGGTIKGDSVKAGKVTLDNPNGATQITSTERNNVIGWKDFSIKSGETVTFDEGNKTNNYLNIVTGNVTSRIDGTMKGGNNVYIANSHGVIFGDGASVDVGNLYVTTQDLTGVDYSQAANSSKIGNGTVIDTSTGKAAESAKADVVSFVDTAGKNLKATKIVLEGRSVRIMNDANIESSEVYTLANTDPLKKEAGGEKEVRPYTGYVHVGYDTSNAAPSTGTGNKYRNLTKDNIYKLVANATELNGMTTNDKDANYMLRKDITLPPGTPPGTPHTPIGTEAAPFKGRFDGMFHEISGLTLGAGTSTEYVGLFGTTDGATIMNVGLKDADLSKVKFGGGLVGHAKGKTVISAVYNESTTSIGAGSEAGGLVGWLDSSSLDNAYNKADVGHGGGLVGRFDGSSKMYAVYNTGAITSGVSSSAYNVFGNYVVTTGSDAAFIKDAYTNRVELTPSVNNSIIYNSYTMDSTGTATLVVPSGTPTTGDGKQTATYEGWDISDEGGENKTWRIFAGQSNPLLTAFMQGTVQAEYSYADFEQTNHGHSGDIANTYTKRIDGTLKTNNGESMPKRTYDATYRKMTKADGTEIGGISDVTIYGYPSPEPAAPKNITLNANHGRRNAGKGKEAMLYSGQHGYDVAGANLHIEKRKVVGAWEDLTIEKEYDTTTDATEALKKSLTADSIRTSGLIAGDDAKVDPSSLTTVNAQFANANAGYGKSLTVSGKIRFKGTDAENYSDIDANGLTPPATGLKGNIRQKTVTIGFKPGKNFNKTYDGTSDVKDEINPKKPVGADVLELTGVAGGEDLNLNNSDITARYMKDKSSDADENALGNAKVNRDIAYKNIKLANGTTGKAKNYRLVDAQGNVLYREGLAGEPTDMTKPENSANPRYIGAVKTDGSTLWGTGTIERRKLDASHFSITGASKEYDGKDYLLVDGTEHKVEVAVNKDAGTAADTTQKGLVEKDKNDLQFTISATDGKAYYKNASNANTKDVHSATSPNGAQFLSYTLKASGSALENYAFEDGGTTKDLTTADTYDIKNAASIKPRDITLDLLKKTGIDKTYDGNANVTGENKVFGTNFGYADGTTDDHKLVEGDGAKIEAKTAVYKKKTGAPEAADKDVSREGGTATGVVTPNGKGVEYTIGLSDAIAAANYRLKYDAQTTNGGANDTVTMTGTGTITPKKLKLASPGDMTRAYDGTSTVYKSQLPPSYKNVTAGVESGDANKVHLDFGTSDEVGTYYTDSTMKTEAKNANATTSGTQIAGKPLNYTVKYTVTPTLDNGNYEVDATTPLAGPGKITTFKVTEDALKFDFESVTKAYNGDASAPREKRNEPQITKSLSKLELDLGHGQKKDFLQDPDSYDIDGRKSFYENEHANTKMDGKTLRDGVTEPYEVTYTVEFPKSDANYDFSGLQSATKYHLDSSGLDAWKVSYTKEKVGYISPREVVVGDRVANLVTKKYNGDDKIYEKSKFGAGEMLLTGNALIGFGAQLSWGGATNETTAEYDSKNAGTNKVVTYHLKVDDAHKHDYYFVKKIGDATAVTELVGMGNIEPRPIGVKFNETSKAYDGTSKATVAGWKLVPLGNDGGREKTEQLIGNKPADPANNMPAGENLQLDVTKIAGEYRTPNNTPAVNVGKYKSKVSYKGIQAALNNSNYEIVDESFGDGEITKRTVNKADIDLAIGTATKVYDGTRVVKKDGRENSEQEYIQHFRMNLGGTKWEDYALGKAYSLESAAYDDPNVAANTAPQPGKIQYKFSLKDSPILKNYDLKTLPPGYTLVGDTLTRTIEGNTITKRPVYAHVVNDNVTKTYNAKKNVIDESRAELSGDKLVTFNNVKNSTPEAEAGLLDADAGKNATTALYTEKNAGDKNRTINYTLLFSNNAAENAALLANYDLRDAAGNAAATLTTTTNTINRRALRLKADAVTKVYDATTTVKVDGAASTKVKVDGADSPRLRFSDDNDKQWDDSPTPVQDDVKFATETDPHTNAKVYTYEREYNSPNATRTEESKKNNVTYRNIQLTGADAKNYFLTDDEKTALAGNDTAGYTMTGYGEITRFHVTKDRFELNFRKAPVEKTYDGTANVGVGDATYNQPANLEGYIESAYVTKADGKTKLFDIGIEKVNSATYRTGVAAGSSDGTADKNVGAGKPVLFNLKFSDAARNNFDFDPSFYGGGAGGNRMVRDAETGIDTYNVYTTGDIKKRLLTAGLERTMNIRKVYDGTTTADKSNLSILNFVNKADEGKLKTTATFDKATATVDPDPGAAATNTRRITYTATLTGDAADNYAFDTLTGPANKTLTATGDIERRKVYAKVTGAREKTYDAGTKVLIGGTERTGEELVTFGKRTESDKDTGLLTGYGTNATTAAYVANPAVPSATAADASDTANKRVDYTLKIDGKDDGGVDYASNYIIYDEAGNVVYDKTRQADGTLVGADTLTTTNNIINRAPLTLKAEDAKKQYDATTTVKKPETLLKITGGWKGGEEGRLNNANTDALRYTATYQDENVNDKGVEYGNIQIVGTGTKKPAKASNYYLSYNDTKLTPSSSETYALHGKGAITKRILTGDDLYAGFTTTPIKKTYDGTTDVKNPAQYVQYMRTRYKKDDGTDLDLAANGYTVERADYLDKADSTKVKAKDVATGKDVKFQFALHDGNFDYSGLANLTNKKPDKNGVYHFSENYGRDKVTNPDGSISETGRGEITGRNVGVTLHLVQKLYDGTTDVKNGYYTRDANGNLIEHKNSDVDWKQVFTLNGTHGEIAGDANSGFANGEEPDFDVTAANYDNKTVNRGPQYTNDAKDVAYQVKLTDPSANRNYTFQYRVVDADGKELAATDTAQPVRDAKGDTTGHTFHGKGDIWQKRLMLHAAGIDRDYNGKAELTPDQRRALTFVGVAPTDRAAFNFSDPNDARAAGFVDRIYGRYGDRSADAFTANAHVKRPAANINGKPEARDVEFTGVKDAFESLLQRGDVANNYFYDGDNTVYGTGTIKPLTRTLQKTWQKGAAFEKMYDGDARAMIGGKHAWESAEAKQAFHDKLRLSVDLGTGEKPIELDYSLYGDAAGDIGEPHYENFSGRTAHHGQDDANVRNSADPNDTLEKDIVYRLKSVDGDKAWQKDPNAPKYKDWELSESPMGKEIRLSDADVDNSAGVKAYITPRAITLKADEYSKIYDGTAGVAAPSLSADALAEKERELRSKLHVTDDKTRELLGRDGVDFTVDAAQSQFLSKSTYRPDADVARDAAGNVPQDGKLVEYKLSKTGGVIEQGNYVLPTGTQTDAFLGAGSITPRTVRVRFNPTDTATPDKIYDGTQYTVKDGKRFSRTFELVPQGVDEGIVATDRNDVKLNKTSNIGRFASPNVRQDNGGVQDVFYNDGVALQDKDKDTGKAAKAANYTLESRNLRDTARITPRPLDIYLKDGDIRKEYDGTTNVADKFQAANNIALVDRNRDVEGIAKPALPTWNAGDAATYDSKDAVNRTVFYNPSWTDGNFVLQKGQKTVNPTNPNDPTLGLAEIRRLEYTAVDSDGRPQMKDGVYGTRIEADGVIDRRKIKIDAAKDADKIYDGKANVLNPLGNLSFKYNGANAEQNEANGLVEGEGDAVKAALRVQGVYRSNDDSAADANAADSDAQDYKKHPVRYTFEKDEARDPVLANYEIATDAGGNTVLGTGIIERRTLNVRPDRQATYTGKGNVNYTGRVEDGSAAVNGNSPLTPEVEAELRDLNRKIFYGPAAGADYRTPGQTDIYGWYLRDDGTPARASGRYDTNYTFDLQATKLSIAPRVDSVVPERTIRPDSKVYERAAFDESNVFGKNKDLDAALAYTGEGVNIGGMKPQQGTSTNASDVGIRQQGTGTNIGSSAGIGGTAGVNGKVQGATSAVNEAARAAGAQPGAAVKPQGTTGGNAALAGGAAGSGGYYSPSAQSGASVKAQGTTGGNAALAGGTADLGGYYSPGAQPGASVKPQGTTGGNAALAGGTAGLGGYYSPGASVKPQGAKSGAAGKPQGAASAVGSAGSTVGAGSVVDRGLAAAAGMSVGSSSDARTGASSSRRSADYSSGSGSYADGSSRAADRGLANALGKGVGSAGYYSGKGYSHTNDDEEEEIKKKTKASA